MAKRNQKNQKRVHVFRHPPKESGESKSVIGLSMPLSKKGQEVAKELANQFLAKNGKPQMIATSVCVRTYQAGMIFAEVCDVPLPSIERGLIGEYQNWERLVDLVSEEPTALSFYEADSEFILGEAKNILKVLRTLACRLELGQNAICVSHGGLIEPTVALAEFLMKPGSDLGADAPIDAFFPEDLKEGEKVVFVFDGDNKLIAVEMQNE